MRDIPVDGDKPGYVDQPVIDPATGKVLYTRKVFEEGFTPGLDEHDGIDYHGDKLLKERDVFDKKNARTTSIYKRVGRDGKAKGEIAVDHEIIDKGRDVVARSRRNTD